MDKKMQVLTLILLVLAIPLSVGVWWVKRQINWEFSYGGKVDARIEVMQTEINDLKARMDKLEHQE